MKNFCGKTIDDAITKTKNKIPPIKCGYDPNSMFYSGHVGIHVFLLIFYQ